MSEIPSSKHPAVDITASPENPELAIAMRFAETASDRSTAELLWALPHLKELCCAQVGNVVRSLLRLLDASKHKPAIRAGRNHYKGVNSSRTTDPSADDMPAMIEFNPGVVRGVIQKLSKSSNVRNAVISRVSTASRPAFVHKSWSNAYGRFYSAYSSPSGP
jgi:hypothetical protein